MVNSVTGGDEPPAVGSGFEKLRPTNESRAGRSRFILTKPNIATLRNGSLSFFFSYLVTHDPCSCLYGFVFRGVRGEKDNRRTS